MESLKYTVVLLLLLFTMSCEAYVPGRSIFRTKTISSTHQWLVQSLEEGQFDSEVLNSDVPVVVDFYANWCGPCKAVAPVFKAVSEEFVETELRFITVDTDVHESTVDAYNIQGLPLFAIFKKGKVIATHSGALAKVPLREFVQKALE